MKVLITDDEALARNRLRVMVEEAGHEVVAEAESGRQALVQYEQHQPEVVLMDIRMPDMDGIEAARHLSMLAEAPAIIFTTAYDDHALSAFEAHALDYLLKPVRRERLEHALERAQRLNRAQREALAGTDSTISVRNHIGVQHRDGLRLIPLDEIVYFIADQKYVAVHHDHGTDLITESLVQLESEFSDQFLRIHRNALVAVNRMQALEKNADGSMHVRLRGSDQTLEVSRRHVPQVRKCLKGIASGG